MAHIAIIGGGPAGLMAAEILAAKGHSISVFERKPTLGRKFLMAGRGGLNLTHSENLDVFLSRYGGAENFLAPHIRAFTPDHLRAWCHALGQETFVGSSGRIFPKSMKASPLLRAWQDRMEQAGIRFMLQHDWSGWDSDGNLLFRDAAGSSVTVTADAVLLALGGASWPKLGSDGGWVPVLQERGIAISALRPANCGFCVEWSDVFRTRFAGTPVKPVILSCNGQTVQSEIMITERGVEGGGIYALSTLLREKIATENTVTLTLDLRPGVTAVDLQKKLQAPRARQSLSTYLKKAAGLSPVAIGLLRESYGGKDVPDESPAVLAARIKALPLTLTAPFPIDRAISSAGGIAWDEIDNHFMLKKMPGIFTTGEMIDWEAPTGGYLLQACFATGYAAARGMDEWLSR